MNMRKKPRRTIRTFMETTVHQNREFITIYFYVSGSTSWTKKPLLEDKERFPDSSFSASASVKGHSPSDARIASGSSWCAPVSDEKHYLQIDFGRIYYLYSFVTYGDSTSPKWVAKSYLTYSVDFLDWTTSHRVRFKSYSKTTLITKKKKIYKLSKQFWFRNNNKNLLIEAKSTQ